MVVGMVGSFLDALPDLLGGSSGADSMSTPCPAEAAQWLPDGGSGATLEVSYTSPRHVIILCRTADGGLYYDGKFRDRQDEHMSIPATVTASGYTARNGDYLYEIVEAEVIVSQKDVEIGRQPLTRTGP
jgi:hypothetical protein